MKNLLLIAMLFIVGCGNVATDPALSRIKVKEDYIYTRQYGNGARVVVVEDTKSGKTYLIWDDKTIMELTDK